MLSRCGAKVDGSHDSASISGGTGGPHGVHEYVCSHVKAPGLPQASEQQAKQSHTPFSAAAPTQVLWTVIGVGLFVALIVLIRDHRVLQRYAYTLALIGLVFLLLPALLRLSSQPARCS